MLDDPPRMVKVYFTPEGEKLRRNYGENMGKPIDHQTNWNREKHLEHDTCLKPPTRVEVTSNLALNSDQLSLVDGNLCNQGRHPALLRKIPSISFNNNWIG